MRLLYSMHSGAEVGLDGTIGYTRVGILRVATTPAQNKLWCTTNWALPIGTWQPVLIKIRYPNYPRIPIYSTTKIMPIATQAISKKQKEEVRIGQVELELRKPGVIVDGDKCVL